MRNPLRSEADAFRFTMLVVGLGIVLAVAGILGGGWVAFGVALGVAIGIIVAWYLRSGPEPAEPAVWERRPRHAGQRRVLVVANETCSGRALLDEIRYRTAGYDADVLVVAPMLTTHVHHWTSDTDEHRAAAQTRLERSLATLEAAGIRARGEIGDEDPIQAIEDALHTFSPDEVIVSTHPPGRSSWLEQRVVERARERFPGVPVTHVVVDLGREAQDG